ncbi:MAG: hypothetical protein WC641_07860 [Patescibacteria group bacterium]
MRTFIICLISSLCIISCSKSTLPAKPAEASAPAQTVGGKKACHAGYDQGDYGCTDDDICPNLGDDVRTLPGYHVIGVGGTCRQKYVHVADGCQHFFCGIDEDCLKAGGIDEVACMHPIGCLMVFKLKK